MQLDDSEIQDTQMVNSRRRLDISANTSLFTDNSLTLPHLLQNLLNFL